MNLITDSSDGEIPLELETTKVTLVNPLDLDDKEPEMFKDRQAEMGWCKHDAPKLENGLMRCPLCGEVAIEVNRGGVEEWDYED